MKKLSKKTEEAIGWGLRVGGTWPYLAYRFYSKKEDVSEDIKEKYHRPMQVAIVPLREWKRLKKLDNTRL